MNQGKMVFTKIMEFAPFHVFKYCVKRYNGDYKARDFTCWRQFLCMSFGQLTHRESLSDTALCLRLQKEKLYQLGIGYPFHKSTISRANETRDWRIFRDFALKLIEQEKNLYTDVNILDNIDLPRGSYLVMDRAYVDFERLWDLASNRINFVIRAKTNLKYIVLDSGQPDKDNGILSDQ